jgi:hypothetical protein
VLALVIPSQCHQECTKTPPSCLPATEEVQGFGHSPELVSRTEGRATEGTGSTGHGRVSKVELVRNLRDRPGWSDPPRAHGQVMYRSRKRSPAVAEGLSTLVHRARRLRGAPNHRGTHFDMHGRASRERVLGSRRRLGPPPHLVLPVKRAGEKAAAPTGRGATARSTQAL